MTTKVLMVCLGNICRSPLAEGIMRKLTNKQEFLIDSAGTANYHLGAAPDHRSIAIAALHNIDISRQQARQLTPADIDAFDHILVMDEENLSNALALCNSATQRDRIALITTASEVDAPHIPDPYYGGDDGFAHVYELLHDCCINWLKKHTK
ncbi:low molecular weight phosphotyrosine protein phosphatase [Flavobacteriaceae bacterium]|nr:low molecular weight phosphotyrosine protein phosphatase [Flavobacteriaceae bacterium]